MNDDQTALANFSGVSRLFPLPNVVLFPNVMQPLHIFEQRYRQMTADALAGDRLIALALLQPGWETDYEGKPAIHPVVCLGRITSEQKLPDGRYNILLRGLCRARITQEVEADRLYRQAQLELLSEVDDLSPPSAGQLRRLLARKVLPWFAKGGEARQQLRNLIHSDLPLGVLCDILNFALPLTLEAKQQLLDELDVELRVRALLLFLENASPPVGQATAVDRKFPPDFSEN